MNKQKVKVLSSFVFTASLLLLIILPFSQIVHANDEVQQAAGFTVETKIPENQIDKRINYFYLHVNPGDEQILEVEISNNTDTKQSYKVQVNQAVTNKNALVVYDQPDVPVEKSLAVSIPDIAKVEAERVTVDAKSKGTARIHLKISQEPTINGILLGGIHISLMESDDAESKGTSVSSTYGYAIGLIVTENPESPLYGETGVELKSVEPVLDYGSKVLKANILNPNPEIMKDVSASGSISKKGRSDKVASSSLKDGKIAPNSVLPFQIDWGKQDVEAGTYVFNGQLKTENQSWKFQKEFTISRETAEKLNKESAFKLVVPQWWTTTFYIMCVLTVLLFILLTGRMVIQKRRG